MDFKDFLKLSEEEIPEDEELLGFADEYALYLSNSDDRIIIRDKTKIRTNNKGPALLSMSVVVWKELTKIRLD